MIRLIDENDRAEWLRMLTALRPGEKGLSEDVERFLSGGDKMLKCVFVHERPEREGGASGAAALGGFIEISERTYAEGCETSPVAFIEGWYVDGDLRHQGIGRALVKAAEKWAKRKGYTEMGSDLLIDNEPSLKAHLALGYREVERLVAMAKKLS
jgi:aminoglycoside 6'-N-acetyltransferase I